MADRISKNYVMTVYPGSANSSTELTELRDKIKNHNLIYDDGLIVKVVGRLGKNNKHAKKYRKRLFNNISLEHASRWDVYVYNK